MNACRIRDRSVFRMRTLQGLKVIEKIAKKGDEFEGNLVGGRDIMQEELRSPKVLTLEIEKVVMS